MSKHKRAYNPKSLRNLPQYKKLSDEEFEDLIELKEEEEESNLDLEEEFHKKVENKLEELTVDYDLSDMKSNDLLMLNSLAQSLVALDDFEILAYSERQEVDYGNIEKINKIQKIISDLRTDISRQQTDLKISRKIRKGDDREDVIQKIQILQDKAQQFYKQKMAYVVCPNCDMLLGTIWVQYPEVNNEFTFQCNRKKGGREPKVLCAHKFTVTSQELWAQKEVSNKPEVLPESIL